jgi:coiled-coil domain-containing protein 115
MLNPDARCWHGFVLAKIPNMSSQPAPPTAPPSLTTAPIKSDPVARLDALLEVYLDRLDTYQQLREKLSINFSAGFLSLAHANRTSNLGSGRRYGEDGYDERMKAGKRVKIHLRHEGDLRGQMQEDIESDENPSPHPDPPAILLTIEQFSASEMTSADQAKSPVPTETPSQAMNQSAKPRKLLNPLNWYGLLVPPPLRAAQTSFTSAVQDPIPQLLNIQTDMARLEAQIRALRKEAGLAHDYAQPADSTMTRTPPTDTHAQHPQAIPKHAPPSNPPGNRKDNISSPSKPKIPPTTTLSSRPKEPPRSRVLKLE